MVIVAHLANVLGDIRHAGTDGLCRQVARLDPEIQEQADPSGTDSREQGIGDGVLEDFLRFLLGSHHGKGRNDRQGNGRYSNELKEAGEDGSDEVEELVEEGNVHPAENGTNDEGSYPKCELTPLGKGIVAGHDIFGCVFDMGLVFLGHNGLPFFFEKWKRSPHGSFFIRFYLMRIIHIIS